MNKIEAKIHAVNTANATAVALYDRLAPGFQPLIGQKVCKADGSFLCKYRDNIHKIVCSFKDVYNIQQHISSYRIIYVVKSCVNYEYSMRGGVDYACVYHEKNVSIAGLREGVITEIYDAPTLNCHYNAEELLDAQRRYEAAKVLMRKIIDPFPEFTDFFRS